MTFIETPIFTKKINELISDEEYRLLQAELIQNPKSGDVIRNSQGLRKLRWKVQGKGKRGGIRVIYYFYLSRDQIFMLYPFKKSENEDLTPEQLKALATYVRDGVL